MVKVGDRVSLFFDMRKKGTVKKLVPTKVVTNQWYTSPTEGATWRVLINFDDGSEGIFPVTEVMRLD